MNNPNVRGYAKGFARRITPQARTPVETAVKAGYLTALARLPSADELADSDWAGFLGCCGALDFSVE